MVAVACIRAVVTGIAHTVAVVESSEAANQLPDGTVLPAIVDGERLASGPDQVAAYLSELRRFVADWNRFQTDACYIDEDGSVC